MLLLLDPSSSMWSMSFVICSILLMKGGEVLISLAPIPWLMHFWSVKEGAMRTTQVAERALLV